MECSMKKISQALVIAGVVASSANTFAQTTPAAPAAAPAPASTFVPKVSLYSEYEYRGISQTSEKPAVQVNLDYTHPSGFYAGAFLSNIDWIANTRKELRAQNPAFVFTGKGGAELDLFAGYKLEVAKDLTLDIGYLRYEYPGSEAIFQRAQNGGASALVLKKPNTDELYAGAAYGPVSLKYSRTIGDAFGLIDTKGSTFAELNYSQEVAPKITLNGQLARENYKNFSAANYTVYKIGASYDLGDGWNVGGYYKDTNAKPSLYTYLGRDWSKGRLVAFVSKSF
jgi:uncharacterized protein (TIGR02001 family)